jgi:hypothetical protein
MPSNKDKLDQCLTKASLDFEAFAEQVEAGRRNRFNDESLGKLLSALVESHGSHLEALKLLAGNVETPTGES